MGNDGSLPKGAVRSDDGQVAVWEFANRSESDWVPYSTDVATSLEVGHKSGSSDVSFTIGGATYKVMFATSLQQNVATGTVRPVRRRVLADIGAEAAAAAEAAEAAGGDAGGDAGAGSGSGAGHGAGDGAGAGAGAGAGDSEAGSVASGSGSTRSLTGARARKLRTKRCPHVNRRKGCHFGSSCWFYHEGEHDPSTTNPPLRCSYDARGLQCSLRASGTCTKVHAVAVMPGGSSTTGTTSGATGTEPPKPPPPLERVVSDASRECCVCMDAPREATLVHGRTGHLVVCLECGDQLMAAGKPCPICMSPIERVVHTFFG